MNRSLKPLCCVVCSGLLYTGVHAAEKADIIVAADGSGKYKTIMEAIKSIPPGNSKNITILVKNGTYNEHVFIDNSYISIIGEDRAKTIVQFSINRDDWANAHNGSTAGSGVIDIGVSSSDGVTSVTATDIVIGNLTVQNTYNSTGVKTHVIRGEGKCNRIFVVNCNVWCTGHDTIALWNGSGMYYHNDCSFKGSIDAVCPRGYCYAVACDFYEVNSNSPLWHEVAAGTTQKFVIRKGGFFDADGNTSDFRLLNDNNSSTLGTRFFLLDCFITNKATTKGNYTEAYFFNCFGENGVQSWYANNLSTASGSPSQSAVTAAWCFDNNWDPENAMPPVLPFSALPQPWDSAYEVSSTPTLKWIAGRNAEKSAVYFGKTNPPPFVQMQTERTYAPGKLTSAKYYWRIDAIDGTDTVKGTVWSFIVVPGVSISFTFGIREKGHARISVYSLLGKKVLSLSAVTGDGGMSVPARALPAGTYIVHFDRGALHLRNTLHIIR